MKYDLAISFTWIYDIEFTELIEKMFQQDGLKTFVIGKFNIHEITELVKENKLEFKAYLDRASDEDDDFSELAQLLVEKGTYIINNYDLVEEAIDKSVMHPKLEKAGLLLPRTIFVPPFDDELQLKITNQDLDNLGKPFVIKPAYYSGGSEGVIKSAYEIKEIETARIQNPDDTYLVQEKIYPAILDSRRAWFRPYWAFGKIILCYWDDQTLLYDNFPMSDLEKYNLHEIYGIMKTISAIAKLDYFSTEIALTDDRKFYVIDYVNDQCDMRLKSNHRDGVPNNTVEEFITNMKEMVKNL